MLSLYGMHFCPFSRKIAFGLQEKKLETKEIIEKIWQLSSKASDMSVWGDLPILCDGDIVCNHHHIACEYLEEAYPQIDLMGNGIAQKIATRKIMYWFDQIFYQDVYLSLFYERGLKSYIQQLGPDTKRLKAGRELLHDHMQYLDQVADQSSYLNGYSFSWADITAASHLSCIDYMGDILWAQFPAAKEWYMKIKSRPTFRTFLQQSFPGLLSSRHYSVLDF